MGRKATDLINNNKIAGLPKDKKFFWKTGFFKPVFYCQEIGNKKPEQEEAS
jgi:hypothetical protein